MLCRDGGHIQHDEVYAAVRWRDGCQKPAHFGPGTINAGDKVLLAVDTKIHHNLSAPIVRRRGSNLNSLVIPI